MVVKLWNSTQFHNYQALHESSSAVSQCNIAECDPSLNFLCASDVVENIKSLMRFFFGRNKDESNCTKDF